MQGVDDALGPRGIFPTPLYTVIATNVNNIQAEIENILPSIEIKHTPDYWGKTHKLSYPKHMKGSLFDQDVVGDYNMKLLSNEIDEQVRMYCNIFGLTYGRYERQSWMAVFDEHDYGHIHSHGSSSISGCYYFSTDGEDGNIFFLPCGCTKIIEDYSHLNGRLYIKPSVGKIVMFPGSLEHGITTNTTNKRRISIAFNINFKR